MSDPRTIIAQAISRVDWERGYSANGEVSDAHRAEADAVFADLTAAGLLLLPGGHSYVERGQYAPAENRIVIVNGPRTGWADTGPIPHSHIRHVIVWPDPKRPNDDWARYNGPWQPATQEAPHDR